MSQDAIKVGIVADDKTAKGINSAKKNISALDRSVKNLGKTFVSVFAAQKIINFTKLSVKAAAADQASAAKLATAVKNLGLEFANPYISDYIASMEKQSKVADDLLRPAFQTLISQTGSLAKSQELLSTAINVSRGSGESLATVSNDLAQAYVGNVKGLKKYQLGLTNAQLSASSFLDIQKLLNSQFSGASQAYLNTYQGQIDTISLAFDNLQESAGRAFFTLVGGSGGSAGGASFFSRLLDQIGSDLESSARSISDFFVRLGMSQNQFDAYIAKRNEAPAPVKGHELFLQSSSNNAAQLKLEKQRQDLIKRQLAAQKALTDQQKKQALLKKQSTIFDMEQIQLVAALKGKLSDEDRDRVKLQLALLQGNEEEATRLTAKIADATNQTGELKKYLNSVEATNNPFKSWQDYLNAIEAQAARIASVGTGGGSGGSSFTMGDASNAAGYTGSYDFSKNPATGGSVLDSYQPTVVVQFAGADSLSQALRDSFVSASMEGSFSQINRTVGAFDR